MFSLTVRRSFMIAHSLPRESFGPAQGLHGATFVAEVGFRRAELNDDSVVIDIGAAGIRRPAHHDRVPRPAHRRTTRGETS